MKKNYIIISKIIKLYIFKIKLKFYKIKLIINFRLISKFNKKLKIKIYKIKKSKNKFKISSMKLCQYKNN